jgi:hypothetical protein
VILRRVILTFERDGVKLRALYKRTQASPGPGPNTRARRREVVRLARTGLEHALKALRAGEVEDLGTSGFETREDILGLPVASPISERRVKGGAPSR